MLSFALRAAPARIALCLLLLACAALPGVQSAGVCDDKCSGGCPVQCPDGPAGCRSGSSSQYSLNGVGYTCCSTRDVCKSVAAPSVSPSTPAATPPATITLRAGDVYTSTGKMGSCIAYHVKSSWAVHVVVMETANYNAFKNNGFEGTYLYVEGSQCKSSIECKQQLVGLNKDKTYTLAVFNLNFGSFVASGTDITLSMTTLTDGTCSLSALPAPADIPTKSSATSSKVSVFMQNVVLYFGIFYAAAALAAR